MKWEPGVGSIRRSWSGDGSLEILGPDDHFEFRDYVIVFAYVVTVDLIAFLFGNAVFAQDSRSMCSTSKCFVDPRATVHDAVMYLWLSAVVAVLTIAITAFWKTGRAVVAGMQAVVFAVVVILAVTAAIHAQGQLQELRLCHLGADGPCVGVHRLS